MDEDMKKIGILTLHYIPNMGAVLQAYATLRIMERLMPDAKIEIIDYRAVQRERMYSKMGELRFAFSSGDMRNLLKLPFALIKHKPLYRLRKTLLPFYETDMKLSPEYSKDSLQEESGSYDAIIVGSDQVWNPYLIEGDYTYLLDFYGGQKFSYASSIGLEQFPEGEKEGYALFLKDFTYISSREKMGKEILAELTGKQVEEVLDPTLLLTFSEWENFAGKAEKPQRSSPYMLVYMVNFSENIKIFSENFSRKKGLETLYITTPAFERHVKRQGARSNLSPYEWVALIKNAEYVVTNSFHGVAFSLNFHKQVFIETENKLSKTMGRLRNIVDNFGLSDHVLSPELINNPDKVDSINYSKVQKILEDRREKSMNYLNKIADVISGGWYRDLRKFEILADSLIWMVILQGMFHLDYREVCA